MCGAFYCQEYLIFLFLLQIFRSVQSAVQCKQAVFVVLCHIGNLFLFFFSFFKNIFCSSKPFTSPGLLNIYVSLQFFPVFRHSAIVVSSGSTSFHHINLFVQFSIILLPTVSYFYFSLLFLLKIYFGPLSPGGHILLGRLIKSIKETLRFSVS